MLDVRQESEYAAGHLPKATHIELGSLAGAIGSQPVTVMCGHGERAMTAATLLARDGHHAVSIMDGGAADWAKATGLCLEYGA